MCGVVTKGLNDVKFCSYCVKISQFQRSTVSLAFSCCYSYTWHDIISRDVINFREFEKFYVVFAF